MLSRQPYQGLARKLILAFDVGTTFSGVSYCILDPGDVPTICEVKRYPAQEQVGGDTKIPSILYYDQQGTVRAIGAEALQPHILERAEDENWTKLEWWKLHLRTKHLASSHIKDDDIPPLPQNIDAVRVLSDFIKYLFNCSRDYIVESYPSGSDLWQSLENQTEFVLTHPNGWEGPQQQQIREAAQLAGLVPSSEDGQSRLHLLTEGEASLNFCVTTVLASSSLSTMPVICSDEPEEQDVDQELQGIIIIDAGGGTVDSSAYSVKLSQPISIEETAPAQCILQGSVHVTLRARQFLRSKLANSRYGTPEMVQQISQAFDHSTKLVFRNPEDPQYIQFGSLRDKEPDYDIRSGRLKIAGQEVAKFFEPSIEGIAEAFEQQARATTIPIKHAFLVGGFAASDYLFTSLQRHPKFADVSLCRPHHVNKAVADGAVSFLIDRLITTRVARFTYGIPCIVRYQPLLGEHLLRSHTKFRNYDGQDYIRGAFSIILEKGTQVSEQREFADAYHRTGGSVSDLTNINTAIYAYRGNLPRPVWMDNDPNSFTKLCTVYGDTTKLAAALPPKMTAERTTYYRLKYRVILLFGLTELKAQISWGIEKRSPASIVYDD